jgi:mycofactocin precursor
MPDVIDDQRQTGAPEDARTTAESSFEISELLVEDVSIDGRCGVY